MKALYASSSDPIKVAVLDTGFAYTEVQDKKELKPYRQRIRKFVNFVNDGERDNATMNDPSGHGTAVAVQILKVSLTAELYICRVAKLEADGTMVPDKSAVENAIKKAVAKSDQGGWEVDIINMSFGWDYDDHPGVREAIQLARRRGVHMFASTSNHGLLRPPNDILYPSRAREVIAIDAADGLGEYARTSASSVSMHGKERRFSAPGVGLLSPNTEIPWTGLSFACPIVAGVGSLILEFARQPPLSRSPTLQAILGEMSTMTTLLTMMSREKGSDGFRFLLPWEVLGKDGESRNHTGYILVRKLRDEYGRNLGEEIYPLDK